MLNSSTARPERRTDATRARRHAPWETGIGSESSENVHASSVADEATWHADERER